MIASVALALAGAALVLLPTNFVTVALAAVATAGFALSSRFGPLGAALLVALVLPWGRGADTFTVDLAGLPIRPQDGAVAVGILMALPRVKGRRLVLGPTTWLLVALLALGAVAFVVGLYFEHPLRDVFRDVRWWLFYAAGILAVWTGTTRSQVLRALLVGMTLFSILVVIASILPVFAGGLKHQELLYDRGTLRMQFGNSAFLLPAIAWFAYSVALGARPKTVFLLGLLLTAVVLSLTRTSIIATVGVLLVVIVGAGLRALAGRRAVGPLVRRAAVIGGTAAVALALGIGMNIFGTPPAAQIPTSGGQVGQQAIDRILFQDDRSDISSLEVGRFPSYRQAAKHIMNSPIVGGGLGKLTEVDYAYNTARAHTIGMLPGVDNAYLTIGLKTGVPGMIVFALLMISPILVMLRRRGRLRRWYFAAWLGLLGLSMTQAFASSLYGPFAVVLLIVLPILPASTSRTSTGPLAPRQAQEGASPR